MSMILEDWGNYRGVSLRRIIGTRAYSYVASHVALDADGSPRAYHPQNQGIDANANAGFPGGGWRNVLAVDPADKTKPFVQTAGPTNGFFVCKTSLRDSTRAESDIAAYVNSETIPYIVFPGKFYRMSGTGKYGDLAMVRSADGKRDSAAIVADGGPSEADLGEMSLALATALGGNAPNPRNGKGAPKGPIRYVIFPGSASSPAWPRAWAEIDATARALLAAQGGW